MPTIDTILDKYIEALGGADALSKITSYSAKGTSTTFGSDQPNPAEIYAKAPDKYVTIVHQREGDMVRTYDGRDAWVVLPLTVTGEYQLTATAAEGGKLDGQMAFPGNIKGFFNTWRVGYPANIADDRFARLPAEFPDTDRSRRQRRAGKRPAGLYRNILLRQADRPAHSYGSLRQLGGWPRSHQIDFGDYRRVAGVMMPFRRNFGWVSGREEYVLTEINPNVSVDDAKFAKPPTPPPPPK